MYSPSRKDPRAQAATDFPHIRDRKGGAPNDEGRCAAVGDMAPGSASYLERVSSL